MFTTESKLTSVVPPSVAEASVGLDLTLAILGSRFPGDTGSARFRQLALVNIIYIETLRGSGPTGIHIARLSGAHPTQIDRLAKELEERGVIDRTLATKRKGAKWVKILSVRADAVCRLKKAHVEATGREVQIFLNIPSTTPALPHT
jgi:hypothetical protein